MKYTNIDAREILENIIDAGLLEDYKRFSDTIDFVKRAMNMDEETATKYVMQNWEIKR